jgi:hypothetical protein
VDSHPAEKDIAGRKEAACAGRKGASVNGASEDENNVAEEETFREKAGLVAFGWRKCRC